MVHQGVVVSEKVIGQITNYLPNSLALGFRICAELEVKGVEKIVTVELIRAGITLPVPLPVRALRPSRLVCLPQCVLPDHSIRPCRDSREVAIGKPVLSFMEYPSRGSAVSDAGLGRNPKLLQGIEGHAQNIATSPGASTWIHDRYSFPASGCIAKDTFAAGHIKFAYRRHGDLSDASWNSITTSLNAGAMPREQFGIGDDPGLIALTRDLLHPPPRDGSQNAGCRRDRRSSSSDYLRPARTSLSFAKFGRSFGVGVCSAYCTTPCLSITKAARAEVSPTPARFGNSTP